MMYAVELTTPTASHMEMLKAALSSLPDGALVIEHGAGMYSTPLLCRYKARVFCAESHPGWAEWARWMYTSAGIDHELADSYKRCVYKFEDCSLLFIDGTARERGVLLKVALERKVPLIVCHDTEEQEWHHYQLHRHYFSAPGYDVSHHDDIHRTTTWRLKS